MSGWYKPSLHQDLSATNGQQLLNLRTYFVERSEYIQKLDLSSSCEPGIDLEIAERAPGRTPVRVVYVSIDNVGAVRLRMLGQRYLMSQSSELVKIALGIQLQCFFRGHARTE